MITFWDGVRFAAGAWTVTLTLGFCWGLYLFMFKGLSI